MPQVSIPALLASFAISTALSFATAAIGSLLAGKPKLGAGNVQSRDQRRKQNITDTAAYIPKLYGITRAGGLRVFAATALAYQGKEKVEGTKIETRGDYLYLDVAWCDGIIDSVQDIYLDGVSYLDPKFESPYYLDVTFAWSFTEPAPVIRYSTYSAGLLGMRTVTNYYYGNYYMYLVDGLGKEFLAFSFGGNQDVNQTRFS